MFASLRLDRSAFRWQVTGLSVLLLAALALSGCETSSKKSDSTSSNSSGPAAPTGLTASASASNRIDLNWNLGGGASDYVVYRSTAPGV